MIKLIVKWLTKRAENNRRLEEKQRQLIDALRDIQLLNQGIEQKVNTLIIAISETGINK